MDKKKKGTIRALIIALIMSVAVFVAIIAVERYMLKNYEKAEVVVALKDIAAGTYITEDNRKEYFGVIELPKDAVMENVIVNIKDIEEYQVSYDMQKNEQLTKNKMLDTTTEILGAYENPVEASLKVENISSAVAGTLRRGDRVDIVGHAGTDENQNEQFVTGDTLETILEDVYISGAYNSNGEEITVDSAINASVVFNFIIEKDDYEIYVNAVNAGDIQLIKVSGME